MPREERAQRQHTVDGRGDDQKQRVSGNEGEVRRMGRGRENATVAAPLAGVDSLGVVF